MPMSQRVIAIVGATGTGKTALAIEAARRLGGGLVGGASLKPEVFSEIIEKTAAARA